MSGRCVKWKTSHFYGRNLHRGDFALLESLMEASQDDYLRDRGILFEGHREALLLLNEGLELESLYLIGLFDYDDTLIGLVKLNAPVLSFEDWELDTLLIHPAYRNQGIGRRAYQEIRQFVLSRGGRCIRVWTKNSNQEAISFFEQLGFQLFDSTVSPNEGGIVHIIVIMQDILRKRPVLVKSEELLSFNLESTR